MTHLQLGMVAVLAPLVAALLLLLIAPLRRHGQAAAGLSLLGASASFAASAVLLIQILLRVEVDSVTAVDWLIVGGRPIATAGFQLDGISVPMLGVVSLVGLCVQVYSLVYMEHESSKGFGRYYTWQSLFLFSMQGLVVAPNMLQLFLCWELVGLCSYLLIGFWYTKPSARDAALKAFWMTKLADTGLLLGLIVQFVASGSMGWDAGTVFLLTESGYVASVAALYFLAVMGKSAQFPLHVWLPDAMEGPTPVSALLHAATMVAAGVYLLVRAFPIFAAAEEVLPWIAVIGGVTAIFAACVAVVQTDIKKVLAYSTCSQLGYMVAGIGSGSLMAGYFHLTTHAFFKALLFLAAGSVIHAVHTNEMPEMGGLRKKMPATTVLFVVGALALAGLPLLSGFYSKDLILETLFEATHHNTLYWVPFLACMAGVGLTAFYMGRAVFMTFFGAPSEKSGKAHEGGIILLAPMVVLAIGSVAVGWGGRHLSVIWDAYHDVHLGILHFTPVGLVATSLALVGIALSWAIYYRGMGAGLRESLAPVAAFIQYGAVDRAWSSAYRGGVLVLSSGLAWFDRYVIDGAINAFGAGLLIAGNKLRGMQTGQVQDYAYATIVGVMALAVWSQVWLGMGG